VVVDASGNLDSVAAQVQQIGDRLLS
jgi:hypothetical protein